MGLEQDWCSTAEVELAPLASAEDCVIKQYPLSLNQQHMWFQAQLDPESSLWNLGARMSLSGALDVQTFVRAIQSVVDRHEILRTVFVLSPDDTPAQQVIRQITVNCPLRELPSNLSAKDRESKAWTRMSTLADPPYDLTAAPLFRTELLRSSQTQHYFLFAFHHLILDAYYSGQMMKEIVSAYDLLRQGKPLPENPALHYGDFCSVQQERWNQGLMAETVTFWREQLREPLPELRLVDDGSSPFPRKVRSQVSLHPDREVVSKLVDVGKQARTTLFRVVVAIWALFFSRLNGSNEVMFDINFSTRPREMGHTIGFFANLLPVRLPVDKSSTFLDLLRAVDRQLRVVTKNREFPVRQLTRKLKGRQDAIRPVSPIVITQFGVLDWSLGELQVAGSMYVTASIHDFWLGVSERDEELEIILAYSDDLFDRSRALDWAMQVEKLLLEVVARPAVPLSEFSLGENTTLRNGEVHEPAGRGREGPAGREGTMRLDAVTVELETKP